MSKKKKSTSSVKPTEAQRNKATVALNPAYNAAAVTSCFSELYGELDFFALADELEAQRKTVANGNLKRAEAMLFAQAQSLDVMFTSLARRGKAQDQLKQYEAHMKLALRAQSQCRATLEALATIKNPPVIFAKQANIAQGHQQVNNGTDAPTSRARENEKAPNELLEHDHEHQLDTGTTSATSGSHPPMEAVAAVHRTAHDGGKGSRQR